MWKSFILPAVIASSFAAGAIVYKMGIQREWWPPPPSVYKTQLSETAPQAVKPAELPREKSVPELITPEIFSKVQSQSQTEPETKTPDPVIDPQVSDADIESGQQTGPEDTGALHAEGPPETEDFSESEDLVETDKFTDMEEVEEPYDVPEPEDYTTEVEVVAHPEYPPRRAIILVQPLHHLHHGFKHHHRHHGFDHHHKVPVFKLHHRHFEFHHPKKHFSVKHHRKHFGIKHHRKHFGIKHHQKHLGFKHHQKHPETKLHRKQHGNTLIHKSHRLHKPKLHHQHTLHKGIHLAPHLRNVHQGRRIAEHHQLQKHHRHHQFSTPAHRIDKKFDHRIKSNRKIDRLHTRKPFINPSQHRFSSSRIKSLHSDVRASRHKKFAQPSIKHKSSKTFSKHSGFNNRRINGSAFKPKARHFSHRLKQGHRMSNRGNVRSRVRHTGSLRSHRR